MPTYEYECLTCGLKFERRQSISEPSIAECPQCRGKVRRLISGGAAFILKGAEHGRARKTGESCSLETTGTTCCGRQERCGKPPCR